jgi:hypothetical protein
VPSDACWTEIGYAQAVATIPSAFDGYTHASRRSPISDHSNPPPVEQPDHRRGACRRARDVQAKRLSRHRFAHRAAGTNPREARLGYVLEGGFDLPPLMLTSDEVEAAVLGVQWATGHGDLSLARAARDLIAKITATVPETLRRSYWTRAHARHRAGKLLRMASTLPELAAGFDPVERSRSFIPLTRTVRRTGSSGQSSSATTPRCGCSSGDASGGRYTSQADHIVQHDQCCQERRCWAAAPSVRTASSTRCRSGTVNMSLSFRHRPRHLALRRQGLGGESASKRDPSQKLP